MATFELCTAVGDLRGTRMRLAVTGIDTRHYALRAADDLEGQHDRGRLWLRVAADGDGVAGTLYGNPAMADPVAAWSDPGVAAGSGVRRTIAAAGDSGLGGWAIVDGFPGGDPVEVMLFPTFATDEDVMVSAAQCAGLPGYGADGLADLHARAVREILTNALPSILPHLYDGRAGAAPFNAAVLDAAALPLLAKLASVEQLRVIQGALVKAWACVEGEHLQEFRDMAAAAGDRYTAMLAEVKMANVNEATAAAQEDTTGPGGYVFTGGWVRG